MSIYYIINMVKRSIKGGAIFAPETKQELITAVNLVSSNAEQAEAQYGLMATWDVSQINHLAGIFSAFVFTEHTIISDWNVSNVTNMDSLFSGSDNFDQMLNWDVSNVTTMRYMFYDCNKFNQPLNHWNVSRVTNMCGMFHNCENFNQPLSNWNVSNVTNMENMFCNCTYFNQPLNTWNVSNVTIFSKMFENCDYFDQPLNNWRTSQRPKINNMFTGYSEENYDEATYCPILQHPSYLPSFFRLNERMQSLLNNYIWPEDVRDPLIVRPPPPGSSRPPVATNYSTVAPVDSLINSDKQLDASAMGHDCIEFGEDVNVLTSLTTDKKNIAFLFGTHYFVSNKDIIAAAVLDPTAIKYKCPTVGSMSGIIRTVPYLNMKSIGIMIGLVSLSELKYCLTTDSVQLVEIDDSQFEELLSTASLQVLQPGADHVGASYCQGGQGERAFHLKLMALLSGGKHSRRRKSHKKKINRRKSNCRKSNCRKTKKK